MDISDLLKSQYDFASKKALLEREIKQNQHGQLWFLANQAASDQEIKNLLQDILNYFKIVTQ